MPPRKDLTKEMILQAQANTKSNRAASRYLQVGYQHYKKWAKLYDSTVRENPNDPNSPFLSLFDAHTNYGGKGIPKFLGGRNQKKYRVIDLIEGRVDINSFKPNVIKDAMIKEGLLKEECDYCKYNERRLSDSKMPLLMYFKDNNRKNYRLGNCVLVCYNCYFTHIGDVFNPKQELSIQDHKPVRTGKGKKVDWELDEYQQEQLERLTREVNDTIQKKQNEGRIDPNNISLDDIISNG